MNGRPLTAFVLTAFVLFGLWLWRRQRFGGQPAGTQPTNHLTGLPVPDLSTLLPQPAFLRGTDA